jgi:hypothetical protein
MVNTLIINIVRFVGLVLFQFLVLDNLHIHQLIHPYIYPLVILLLPLVTPAWAVLFLGFALGITVDIFSDTLGLHAAACVVMAYLRTGVLSILTPKSGYDSDIKPKIGHLGFTWFITYSAILVIVHHLAFFLLEALSFTSILLILQKILINTALSLALMILYEFVFFSRRKRR